MLKELLKSMRISSLRNRKDDLLDAIDIHLEKIKDAEKHIKECGEEIDAINRRLRELQPPRGATFGFDLKRIIS